MASPITIHATHPTSHFFREHSNYPQEYRTRRLGGSAMGPYRAHPYQRDRSHSPPKRGIDYRSTRFQDSSFSFPQPRPPSRGPVPMQPHHHSMPPQHGASSRPSSMPSEAHRIGVDQLVESYPSSRPSPSQRDLHLPSRSPTRGSGDRTETARLPGIGSLLGLRPEAQRHDLSQHPLPLPPPATSGYRQPRYQGHSAASSTSSAFSEPVSPSSYGGHTSRSPIPQAPHLEDRGRAISHYMYSSREEPSHPSHPSQYEHSRSQTLPSIPVHAHQPASNNYPPPPPPPSGPNTMLPPPPDPFYQNAYSQRPSYPYGQAHSSQLGQSWDRPRMDSAIPVYEHPIPPPGYGWGFPGHHAANSMARKRRGNLPKEATKILKDWFGQHHDSPYPTEDEKQELCRTTGLQISQVNNWFINARRRLPREDAKKLVEQEAKERAGTADSGDSDMQLDEPSSNSRLATEGGVRY